MRSLSFERAIWKRLADTYALEREWENFLNYSLLSIPKKEYIIPTVEELCGEYLAKWARINL